MTLRALMLTLAVVAVCAVAATLLVLWVGPEAPGNEVAQSTNELPYAYITSDQLVVMRGTRTVVRVDRVFDEADSSVDKFLWTADKKYVVLLSDASLRGKSDSEIQLLAVNSTSGVVNRISCPGCNDFITVGDHSVLVESQTVDSAGATSHEYRVLDATTDSGGRQVFLPTGDLGDLGDSSKSFFVVQGIIKDGQQHAEIYRFPEMTFVKAVQVDAELKVAIFERSSRDAKFVAAGTSSSRLCSGALTIGLVDAQERITQTDESAMQPTSEAGERPIGAAVNDFWMGADGEIRARVHQLVCRATPSDLGKSRIDRAPFSTWGLSGTVWQREMASPEIKRRPLNRSTSVRLVINGCNSERANVDKPQVYCNVGKLLRDGKGADELVADGVIDFAVPVAG